MQVTPGQLLTVDFKIMFKTFIITLFLFFMNTAAYTQNVNLTPNGLMQFQIGDTLSLHNTIPIIPVEERKDFLQIFFWGIEHFNYYYIDHAGKGITLDSSVIAKDIFLYSDKKKEKKLGGILLFVNKQYDSLLVALLNRVFGPLQLESSLGVGDEEWRVTRLWAKEQMRVFVTDNYTDVLEVSISPRRNDVRDPGMKFRN